MINQHTLDTLEFPKIISQIAGKCITPYGGDVVRQFAPMVDKSSIDARQAEIAQMLDIIKFGYAFPLSRMNDCREILDKTRVEGVYLDPDEIRQVLELIEISSDLHRYDKEGREKFPDIAEHLKKVRSFPELQKQINKTIDETGEIKDNASVELRRTRRELVDSKRRIINSLEGIITGRSKQSGWQDDVITQRNGRYVIPVIAGQYKSDQGILHDRSQSGATFYIEPNETVELNNRLNLLMQKERAEIVRILRALTAEITQRLEALCENIRLIGHLDSIYAAAQFAKKIDAHRPVIDGRAHFDLIGARHPLLILQHQSTTEVVPLSLKLNNHRRAVVITGPNTGGKTIALKTIGLMALMAQAGLPVPADEKSTLGIFDQVFADIGDEQSIELSLSTFSSHIRNTIQSINNVSDSTLVLLDEIGVGTDPKEGAALAEVVIHYLVDKGAILVTSTHYSQLKTLALDHPEIENASLEFDRETLAPTYRLELGIPGSSYAIEIASRLGLPESICDRASELIGEGERSLAELIGNLESELVQVREDRIKLTERLASAEELERFRKAETEKFQDEIDRIRQEALAETSQILNRTRKETERLVAEIRKSQANGEKVKKVHQFLKETTGEIENLQKKLNRAGAESVDQNRLASGDVVKIISLNQEGVIEEFVGSDRVRVRVGSINTVVEVRNLEKIAKVSSKMPGRKDLAARGTVPETGEMSPELHLRGMTVEEAREAVDRFLDRAVIAGLHQVYVIHGKGTGALRRNLTEQFKKHPEVESMRLGNWNEGGAGVTVLKLKR